jgi:alpha-tubulin suppressor-like RCC1 family protein
LAGRAGIDITLSVLIRLTVYAFGSGEHGQLGNGRTGEHITAGNKTGYDVHSDPGRSATTLMYVSLINSAFTVPVKGLIGKTIVDIAAGNQHSIILDSEG